MNNSNTADVCELGSANKDPNMSNRRGQDSAHKPLTIQTQRSRDRKSSMKQEREKFNGLQSNPNTDAR